MGVKPMQADAFFPFSKTPSSAQPSAIYKLMAFNVPTPSSLSSFLHSEWNSIAFSRQSSYVFMDFTIDKYCC